MAINLKNLIKMKNLILATLSLFLTLSISSCSEADREADFYKGDAFLNFNKGLDGNAFVVSGTGHLDYPISYGTVKPVTTSGQVKLVVDAANSTAVEGVDFQILNNATDELTPGETGGTFTLRALEAAASQTPKTVTFKLQSSSFPNAIFDQKYTLNISLTCPLSSFLGTGSFSNTTSFWNTPGGIYEIEESTTPNQLLVKDFWDIGIDMVLNYNPSTFVVTIPDQDTGYAYNATAHIWAKPSTDVTQVSSFNPCTRKMTLYVYYYVPGVGSYGNKIESFSGL
ncbi:hypothetical protein [Chryseobacterium sp.]|uniref:hypothetical protein n=1 Tax=Chryseobacterium sp. TaxID=1871047 RepID=UPI0011CA3D65|nr:hypothetical protein [Chryseobacterium sp.]TXF76230.1 hypothetical protein FUA25_10100 [Chryseobacterium sp.]